MRFRLTATRALAQAQPAGRAAANRRATGAPTQTHSTDDAETARRAILALAAAAEAHDAVAPLSEAARLALGAAAAPALHVLVWPEPGAETGPGEPLGLLGYAQLDPATGSAELVVAPAARRRGVGRALAQALSTAAPPDPGTGSAAQVRVWAHGDLPASRAFAAAVGAKPARELVRMTLGAAPASSQENAMGGDGPRARSGQASNGGARPGGWTVRPFRPGRDQAEWLALNAAAFADHPEQGRLTRGDLEARLAEPWFDPAGFLLAQRAGSGPIRGFSWTKLPPGESAGEIYALGVAPGSQGQGLGRFLLDAGLAHLAGRGAAAVQLYVEGDNAPALALYRSAGFAPAARDLQYALPSRY